MTLSSISDGMRPFAISNSGYKQVSAPNNHTNSKQDVAIISEQAKELAAQKAGNSSSEEASESASVEAREQASGLK